METTARPRRRQGTMIAEVRGRHVVFDPHVRQLYELREDAASLWPTLDGSATFGALVQECSEVSGLATEEAEWLLRSILDPLLAAGLVVTEPDDPGAMPS